MQTWIPRIVLIFSMILMPMLCGVAHADARFCGVVYRESVEPYRIIRSAKVKADFKREWPCSTCTMAVSGTLWQVDHVIPLVCGGCDSVENMAWMPVGIKTCAGTICKDRWEQLVYCGKPVTTVYK